LATYKELTANDIQNTKTFLNQLIDVIQEDVSGSTTRQKYQVFVTGGVGPGVTSSLFQTVHDQDYSLQTANPIFDMTVGLYYSGSTVQDAKTGEDSAGKQLFASSSLMMREKVDIYRQTAKQFLGDATSRFYAPFDSTAAANTMDEMLIISFKRLFHRDQIKRETFAMKFFQSATRADVDPDGDAPGDGRNLWQTTESGSTIFTDVGSAQNKNQTFGGNVGTIVDSADTSRKVGLLFYDHGTALFDIAKIISGSQKVSGAIDAMNAGGTTMLGRANIETYHAKFIPDFVVSASLDDVIDHFATTRFSSGSATSITFQNVTNINSTLIFCRADPAEFNYSSNPTYVDSNTRMRVIDQGQEDTQIGFTFVTTIGLYDAQNNLLAVAKTSRPVEKNNEKDLSLRVRLDF